MTEPLVLLPGLGCDARLFRDQTDVLSRLMPVMLAPAAVGERIEEIASALLPALPQRFALAGHGLGGAVAMEILRRAPERVLRLALISATPLAETPAEAAAREPRIIHAKSGRLKDAITAEIPAAALAPTPERPRHLALLQSMAADLGIDAYLRQSRALQRRRDQQATVRRCRVPTLILCGAHDSLAPVKRQSFLAELIPAAELRVIEEAGHLAPLEAPEAVTEALFNWMRAPAPR